MRYADKIIIWTPDPPDDYGAFAGEEEEDEAPPKPKEDEYDETA